MERAVFNFNYSNPTAKERNDREEIVNKFMVRINPSRIQAGFRELAYPAMATLFQKIPTDDLNAFYSECDKKKVFSAYFWWKLKQK